VIAKTAYVHFFQVPAKFPERPLRDKGNQPLLLISPVQRKYRIRNACGNTETGYTIGMQGNLIAKIHTHLIARKKTIAVAESCTGGLLSKLLTDLPGSSGYFILGVVAYHNKAKESILKIPSSLIAKKGAVSKETALAMATQVRRIAKADIGIGITGIAGPAGGTIVQPVGTVYIAAATKNQVTCARFLFKGSRSSIRRKATLTALKLVDASPRYLRWRGSA